MKIHFEKVRKSKFLEKFLKVWNIWYYANAIIWAINSNNVLNAPGYFKVHVLHIALKYQKEKLASPFLSIAFIKLTAKVSFNCASCEKLLDKANKEKYFKD